MTLLPEPTCHDFHRTLFVATTLRRGSTHLRGPAHRIAGYHEPEFPATPTTTVLFGDYETACGIRIPRFRAESTNDLNEFPISPSRCGDCFAPKQRE